MKALIKLLLRGTITEIMMKSVLKRGAVVKA